MTGSSPGSFARAGATASLTLMVAIALALAPARAIALPDTMTYRITGPGTVDAGREVRVSVSITNSSVDPTVTPTVINSLSFASRSIGFNGNTDSVATCHAKIPNNGERPLCPRRSLVGNGEVNGILGTTGQPVDTFGALSYVVGRFKLYNYKRRGREAARLVAVIETVRPLAGFWINLQIPISRDGEIDVDVPELAQLPTFISASYPLGTRLVLTKLSARIDPPRRRHSKPFVWLRRPGSVGMSIQAISE